MKMAVQAIIMAGGEGVRLRPLTMHLPKPLVPLLGEPAMGYALKLLRAHGVQDVGATLCYQPKKIRAAFGKGEKYGVKLRYYEETAPLGTAGSVRMARDWLRGTFLVLSGDGVTDCDLTRALSFHREKKALATLVLKRVSVPLPYGVVLTGADSRITRFIEKPTWSRVFSDLVNTGIYILEPEIFDYIADTGTPDFGKDVFPLLLEKGLPIYGFETTGYWCDIGDQRAYLDAQRAMLAGEVNLPHPTGIHPLARVDAAARIEGNCLIGKGAVIGPGAVVRGAVIGEKCVIGAGAAVENACLWERAVAQEKAELCGCVLCDGAVARQGAVIADGCALGQGAIAGAGAALRPGVKIWPHLKVAPGAVAAATLAVGDLIGPQWTARGADCDTPETICALCAAYARVTCARQVLVAHGGASALAALASGALAAAGVRVLQAGEMTGPMLQALVPALRMDGGVFAMGQTLRFLSAQGAALSSRQTAAMDAAVLRQDNPPAFARPGNVIRLTGAEEIYLAKAVPQDGVRPLWSPVAVLSDNALLRRLALSGLERMNARDARAADAGNQTLRPNEVGFLLSASGEEMGLFTQDCRPTHEQKTLLLLSLCLKQTGCIYDLPGVPRAAERLAALRPADESEACRQQRLLMQDGLAALLTLCQALKDGPLEALLAGLPETHIQFRDFPCPIRDKGRILHTLCDQLTLPHTLGEGVRIRHEQGYATIVPDAHRGMVHVTSEARDSEFAQELCDFYIDRIRAIAGDRKKE